MDRHARAERLAPRPASAPELLSPVGIGAPTPVGQVRDLHGFRSGEPIVVAPFAFTQLLFVALLGYMVPSDVRGWRTIAGAAGSGATGGPRTD